VVKFNRPAIEARVKLLAAYLGIEGGFNGFYAWLIDFSRVLRVPEKMSALGVDRDQIDLLAKMAVEDPSAGGNPIPLTTEITKKLYDEIICICGVVTFVADGTENTRGRLAGGLCFRGESLKNTDPSGHH